MMLISIACIHLGLDVEAGENVLVVDVRLIFGIAYIFLSHAPVNP
jgi:hypothetical protein